MTPPPSRPAPAGAATLACDCCGAEGIPLGIYAVDSDTLKELLRIRGKPPTRLYCRLCSHTYASMMVEYSAHHDADAVEVAKIVCFVGNEILKAIKGLGAAPGRPPEET